MNEREPLTRQRLEEQLAEGAEIRRNVEKNGYGSYKITVDLPREDVQTVEKIAANRELEQEPTSSVRITVDLPREDVQTVEKIAKETRIRFINEFYRPIKPIKALP